MARLRATAAELQALLRDFDPGLSSGPECATLAEELATTAKACASASARAVARAVECNQGDVEWVARTAGSTTGEARAALSTVTAAADCPATSEALASGRVSLSQAREIVAAEAAVPGSEAGLLDVAATSGMSGLRDEARRVVLGSMDRDALHAEQHRSRSVQHWVDDLGMVAGRFRLSPEVGVPFVNRLDAATDRVRRAARREGSTEAREAHAADALVTMMSAAGRRGSRADVVFVCSLDAYRRGRTEGDELCHVIGSGPVPVGVVRDAVADDAFVKAVVTRGVLIDTVAHLGRRMSAELRTALELGAPPGFAGAVCVEAGCDRRHGLELDHVDPVAHGGRSSYENLEFRCGPDHWAKTERDRRAGLLDGNRGPPE